MRASSARAHDQALLAEGAVVVLPFWRRMGFVETGERRPYRGARLSDEVLILAKTLPPAPDCERR